MKYSNILITEFTNDANDHLLTNIYNEPSQISYQKQRYINAIQQYEAFFGRNEIEIFSAPGRSEICGNHTDHQHGEVLATAIHTDIIAIVSKIDLPYIKILSDGDVMLTISLNNLVYDEKDKGTTLALIKGVLAGFKKRGYNTGGFQAYITSDIPIGAGLSSSAAFEILLGIILSGLYNNMEIDAFELATIGQYAENIYFGKPCGLMDQMTCSIGNMIHIDFKNPEQPAVNSIDFNLQKHDYCLCIVNTKGSHANLTADYSAIPQEMKSVAACFGKEVLQEVNYQDILTNLPLIRSKVNDRAVLRAIHYYEENKRVRQAISALERDDISEFLQVIQSSGNSSFQYLQNIYTNQDVEHQNLSIALAVSDCILGNNGVCRVHGGGFAGTIQAFVKREFVDAYQKKMNLLFGEDACSVFNIRKYGGIRVI